jgi:hypothetical protein
LLKGGFSVNRGSDAPSQMLPLRGMVTNNSRPCLMAVRRRAGSNHKGGIVTIMAGFG